MGLMDFFKSGEEKPVENKNQQQNKDNFFKKEAQPAPAARQPHDTYTVRSGDSLSKIAKHYYGDAQQWKKIHQANLDQIKDPNLIYPGQQLIIPQ